MALKKKRDLFKRKLRSAIGAVDRSFSGLVSVEKALGKLDGILEQSVRDLKVEIRRLLLTNYARSGLIRRSGRLQRAVSLAEVSVGKTSITIGFPRSGFSQGKKNNVYIYGSALNFGAVRLPKTRRAITDLPTGSKTFRKAAPLGAKAKRTLKKKALGQALSKRAASSLRSGIQGKIVKRRGFASRIIKSGSKSITLKLGSEDGKSLAAVVIRPRPFFFLTKDQVERLQKLLIKKIQARLDAKIGRGRAA